MSFKSAQNQLVLLTNWRWQHLLSVWQQFMRSKTLLISTEEEFDFCILVNTE